jgi:A/G-specific adenine glycosylase
MLQQTGTERVAGKYGEFINVFPDVRSLSKASPARILAVWKGLGYNRRALSILKTARAIVAEHDGRVPRTRDELLRLPGIGGSTAGGICAFAFNTPTVFIETNIRRVFIHFFFPSAPKVHDADILPLVERTLDRKNPREWYYALMDYGAMLASKGRNPNLRSAQYARQPAFEGSRRQTRGMILGILLSSKPLSIRDICVKLKRNAPYVKDIVQDLVAEGFLMKIKGRYSLTGR